MGVFHVFKIVQMVPNRATHHIFKQGTTISEKEKQKWNKFAHKMFACSATMLHSCAWKCCTVAPRLKLVFLENAIIYFLCIYNTLNSLTRIFFCNFLPCQLLYFTFFQRNFNIVTLLFIFLEFNLGKKIFGSTSQVPLG